MKFFIGIYCNLSSQFYPKILGQPEQFLQISILENKVVQKCVQI